MNKINKNISLNISQPVLKQAGSKPFLKISHSGDDCGKPQLKANSAKKFDRMV